MGASSDFLGGSRVRHRGFYEGRAGEGGEAQENDVPGCGIHAHERQREKRGGLEGLTRLAGAPHACHYVQAPLANLRVGLDLHEQPQPIAAHPAHEHGGIRLSNAWDPDGRASHKRVPPLHLFRVLHLLPEESEVHRWLLGLNHTRPRVVHGLRHFFLRT